MTAKLLIVDDDLNQLDLLKRLLQLSYEVITADGGKEALEIVERENPDLIILDYMMPELSGLEVCKQIRAKSGIRQPQIIMLTAHDRALDRVQALLEGANDYINKPFHTLELVTRVNALLHSHE